LDSKDQVSLKNASFVKLNQIKLNLLSQWQNKGEQCVLRNWE